MVRIAGTIHRYTEMDEILSAIAKELSKVVRFDRSSVTFFSPDEKHLILQHIFKKDEEAEKYGAGRQIELDETTVVGWVVTNRTPILRRDIARDDRFVEIVQEENLQSDIVVPLIIRGRVIGTLNVGSYTKNALTEKDLEILENCGTIACGAIEHVLLLREAKEIGDLYRTLQQNASDMIMLVDRNTGKLLEINRKCSEVLGYDEEELASRTFFDLFPQEDQLQARRDFINVLSHKSESFVDRRFIGKDGRIVVVDISVNLITVRKDTYVQVMVHDISQRKMLEQQIILQNKNLQEANKKLREVDRMKTEFLGNISHELRTPLSIIIAYSESLREPGLPEDVRNEFLDIILENGGSLLRLINDLLDLSKLEVSGAMLHPTLTHVHDVVRSIWTQAEKKASEKSIGITFTPGYEVPVAYLDISRIQQVLWCLVQNAIKFTPPGGTVEVRTKTGENGVWIQVEDSGAGIAPDQIPGIFDTFRQLDGSSTREIGGLGIGLAMAKHIVELHGGRIRVESKIGKGSLFTFVLPVDGRSTLAGLSSVDAGRNGR